MIMLWGFHLGKMRTKNYCDRCFHVRGGQYSQNYCLNRIGRLSNNIESSIKRIELYIYVAKARNINITLDQICDKILIPG